VTESGDDATRTAAKATTSTHLAADAQAAIEQASALLLLHPPGCIVCAPIIPHMDANARFEFPVATSATRDGQSAR